MRKVARPRLKFPEETGVPLRLAPLYGRAAPGGRGLDRVPRNYGRQLSVLAVLSPQGLSAPMRAEGPVDAAVSGAYIERARGPTLAPGAILVMDNLAVHKVAGIPEATRARGARVEYLPPYSPDLSPIEHCWSKLKTALRHRKARTRKTSERALAALLPTISPSDAQGWFRRCGYSLH
jgi:transposase